MDTYARFPRGTVAHGHTARRIVRGAGLGILFPFQTGLRWVCQGGLTAVECHSRSELAAAYLHYRDLVSAVLLAGPAITEADVDLWPHLSQVPFAVENHTLRAYAQDRHPRQLVEIQVVGLADALAMPAVATPSSHTSPTHPG